jgi:UDP-2-acetamido-2,6-beta-L-arabino-hexul-4-ose reductase
MKVLITGADGFIGKNLRARLSTHSDIEVLGFTRHDEPARLADLVRQCDAVVHLAGENRPPSPDRFEAVNVGLTKALLDALSQHNHSVAILFSSSTQAAQDNAYGRSKRDAETLLEAHAARSQHPVAIYRLPGVFGKWARPNYNSVVATFCHNIATGLPIQVDNPATEISLVYIDDVVDEFVRALRLPWQGLVRNEIQPLYRTSVGDLAQRIHHFHSSRPELQVDRVGTGFTRALYATYVSYLPQATHAYPLTEYADPRGVFVEFLKTPDAGQFSYFTSQPGITRGGHFHDTKTEMFLVVQGEAVFGFRHVLTGEVHSIRVSGTTPTVVQTIPGWAHDITNVGTGQLIAFLWANEVFDRTRPDTFTAKV